MSFVEIYAVALSHQQVLFRTSVTIGAGQGLVEDGQGSCRLMFVEEHFPPGWSRRGFRTSASIPPDCRDRERRSLVNHCTISFMSP